MSYVDALNDNIKTGQLNGMTVYYPLCHVCGEPMLTYSYRPNLTFTCKGCKLDKYLSDITRLVPAFRKVKENRNLIRQQHGGVIPDWYSKKAI